MKIVNQFQDLRNFILRYDFSERVRGDHHIFSKENVFEIINLQPLKDGKAKPYQVKQIRKLFLKYKFHLNEEMHILRKCQNFRDAWQTAGLTRGQLKIL